MFLFSRYLLFTSNYVVVDVLYPNESKEEYMKYRNVFPAFSPLKSSLFLLVLILTFPLGAQDNMVSNGSFEKHNNRDCLIMPWDATSFSLMMPGWNDVGSNPGLCDCNCTGEKREKRDKRRCPENIKPKSGCSMMQLEYSGGCMDALHKTQGCSDYLGAMLSKPMQLGTVYEVSFWIYIKGDATHPEYTKQLGMNLFPRKIAKPFGGLVSGTDFTLDEVRYDEWYQVNWQLKPLCDLKYLVIGVFRGKDGPPIYQLTKDEGDFNEFFIDDVEVRKVSEDKVANAQEVVKYCKYDPSEDEGTLEVIEDVNCYFATGESVLTLEEKNKLDTFAKEMKARPNTAFTISGHTDNVGSNHQELAAERIESVISYLETNHKIKRVRLVLMNQGADRPAADNTTDEGRRLNRRVEIKMSLATLPDVLYRNALEAVFAGDHKTVFKTMNAWMHFGSNFGKIMMLADPRFDPVKSNPRWKGLQDKVRKSYKNSYAYQLDEMWVADQKTRTLKYYIENLAAYFQGVDGGDTRWDVNFPELSEEQEKAQNEKHYNKLVALIDKYGYPKVSEVGERPAQAAFFVIQHQSDVAILEKYIPILYGKCMEGEASWNYYAMLYDRVQVMKDLPQKYGTQSKIIDKEKGLTELFPLEDESNVNVWRDEIGLDPIDLD